MAPIVTSEVDDCDVSAVHRLGKKNSTSSSPCPVIARFNNRRARDNLMSKKKILKNNDEVKNNELFADQVTLTEDLTLPRRKLLKTVRELDVVEFAYVKDSAILAKQRGGPFIKI